MMNDGIQARVCQVGWQMLTRVTPRLTVLTLMMLHKSADDLVFGTRRHIWRTACHKCKQLSFIKSASIGIMFTACSPDSVCRCIR